MKKTIYLLSALLVLTGCLKDRTVTEFANVELPVLVNPDKNPDLLVENHEYVLKHGDFLQITPEIVYSNPSDLAYKWMIDGKTVSEEKNLRWECDLTKRASAALYITRMSVGTSVIVPFIVNLDRPYERGWVVTTDNNGKIVYNFLQEVPGRPSYKYNEYPGFYLTESTSDSWIDAIEFWSNEGFSVQGHMLHLDKDLEKCQNLDELTMAPTVTLKQEFFDEKFPEEVKYFKDVVYSGFVAYLLGDNGKLYGRKGGRGYYTGKFLDRPMQFEGKELKISYLVNGPYNAGIVLIFDEEHSRFLSINNGYVVDSNEKAGLVSKLPDSSAGMNNFAGEDIVYSRLLMPAGYGEEHTLFLVSRNRASGVYSASEYQISVASNEVIAEVTARYEKRPIPNFGEQSVIVALENPMGFVGENVYYTDNADPSVLYYAKRADSGLTEIDIYHKFETSITSMDLGKIQTSFQNIAVSLENNKVLILDLSKSKNEYVAPDGDRNNSLLYEWANLEGKVLKVDFRYGNSSNYF